MWRNLWILTLLAISSSAWADIALRDSATSTDDDGTDGWSMTVPTHVTGDYLACAADSNGNAAMVTPSGFTELGYETGNSQHELIVFGKIAASASETVTIDDTTASEKYGACASYSGVDGTTPIDTSWASNLETSTASPTHTGVTSTDAGWAIAVLGHDDGSDNLGNGANNGTCSGWTTIEEGGNNPFNGGSGVGMAYKSVAATTASGCHEWLLDGAEQTYSGTFVLKAGASGSTPLRRRRSN